MVQVQKLEEKNILIQEAEQSRRTVFISSFDNILKSKRRVV